MTRHAMIFALFLTSTATVFAQDAFKCSLNGTTVYQDRPCPGSTRRSADLTARPVTPTTTATTSDAPAAPPRAQSDLDRNKAYLAGREKERRINDLKSEIARNEEAILLSQHARDSELQALRTRKSLANNNLAGATLEQGLATEMQAVTSRYDTDIAVRQDKLKQLREDLARAQKD